MYHKIGFDTLNTLVTRNCSFLKKICFRESHDQTCMESLSRIEKECVALVLTFPCDWTKQWTCYLNLTNNRPPGHLQKYFLNYRSRDDVGAFSDHRPLCYAATEHGRHRIEEWWLAASNRPDQQQPKVLQIVSRRPHVLYFLFQTPQQLLNL